MRSIRIALFILSGVCSAVPVRAQTLDTVKGRGSDWMFGASIGVPGWSTQPAPQLFTLGLHWTQLRPGRLGADVSIGTIPRLIPEGMASVGVRGGVALPMAIDDNVFLLPSAGLSAIGVAGTNGGGGVYGFNTGIAALIFGTGSVGLRTGVTWHYFSDAHDAIWLAEVGLAWKPTALR